MYRSLLIALSNHSPSKKPPIEIVLFMRDASVNLTWSRLVSLRVLIKRVSSLIRVFVEGVTLVENSSSFPRKLLARKIILRLRSGQKATRQCSKLHTVHLEKNSFFKISHTFIYLYR